MPLPHVALIIGHTASSPGAVSVDGTTEHEYNSALAGLICARLLELGLAVSVVRRGEPNDYSGLPQLVNETRADFAVSLHFNAHRTQNAHGAEILYWGTSGEGMRLATRLQAEFVARGFRNRGVKPQWRRRARGGNLLKRTAMPCVIAEPGFGSSSRDWHRLSDMDAIAGAYVRGIVAYASEVAA